MTSEPGTALREDGSLFHLLPLFAVLLAHGYAEIRYVYLGILLHTVVLLLSREGRGGRELLILLACPVLLLTIGIHGYFTSDRYDFLKDGWYFSNLVIYPMYGYLLSERVPFSQLSRTVVLCGVILALIHIGGIAVNPPSEWTMVDEIRSEYGGGTFAAVVALGFLVIPTFFGKPVLPGKALFFLSLLPLSISVALSLSRFMWVSVFFIVSVVLFDIRSYRKMAVAGTVAVVLATFCYLTYQRADYLERGTLLWKFSNAVNEIMPAKYYSRSDMIIRWRGHESYQALLTYQDGAPLNKVFGYGFGKLIDTSVAILGEEEDLQFIPILHNGYLYVLIKTGAAGLLVFLVYLGLLLGRGVVGMGRLTAEERSVGKIMVWLCLTFIFNTVIVGGMFNKSTLLSGVIALGLLYGFRGTEEGEGGPAGAVAAEANPGAQGCR